MIATLKRFFSRRGTSSSICTDNATNFKGANSDLKRLQSMFSKPPEPLANYLTNEQVTWTFIPPRSPNFGGLWEAGVKSFKHHLKRTVDNSRLTIEQFLTIVIQIEEVREPNFIKIALAAEIVKRVNRPISNMYFGEFALKDSFRAYLPLQYFKSCSEEHVHQVSSKLASMSVGLFVTCLPYPSPRDWARDYLPLQYFKTANEELVYKVSSKLD
ncbi:hypothetical protein AVEN_7280-1 [Araneus ventricosus]|uniref:Integrase catalytic domain-containing protein n=1 Tax=Araneus ventricosus TaxID=182803 RepID=A0A4Y2I6I5_ARAVE|nr:hypothetical protein AVEN_7280-1 [Araneus ventricosus]